MYVVYIHVCCLFNYVEVFRSLIQCIHQSGLYDAVDEIRCCVLGHVDVGVFQTLMQAHPKIKIHASSPDVSLHEVFTINTLHEDCKHESMNVLYLHTKGITKSANVNVKCWVQYMCFFLIDKYKECFELLKVHDTVGVNLHDDPVLHYSGNFWWATSAHIKNLSPCSRSSYYSPEFWLTEKRIGKHHCMWESNVDHYHQPYALHLYI
jgi:hypothetical protein